MSKAAYLDDLAEGQKVLPERLKSLRRENDQIEDFYFRNVSWVVRDLIKEQRPTSARFNESINACIHYCNYETGADVGELSHQFLFLSLPKALSDL